MAQSAPPTLPKGGGALRGIGEKFSANPVTGTGALRIPVPVSPGRGGFAPDLSLAYDSGNGNGVFGLGWALSLPAVTRKTEKGLPRYDDRDTFLLSGSEDLVVTGEQIQGDFRVRRFRPRVDKAFARIERWTRLSDGDTHWRSIDRGNIASFYGLDEASRITDPADPSRVFSWLIARSEDDKGNAMGYAYAPADDADAGRSLAAERNRTDAVRRTNRYLQRIRYGNRTPGSEDFMFEVALDYAARPDPFSSYRAGFEVRTTRLCTRIRMLHHIPDPGYDGPVHSLDLDFTGADPRGALLRSVTRTGLNGRAVPPVEFGYSRPVLGDTVEDAGLQGAFRWADLRGDGVPGLLLEGRDGWYYRRNLSPAAGVATFGPAEPMASLPPHPPGARLMDLAGDGRPDLVVLDRPAPGSWEQDEHDGWRPFRPFRSAPHVLLTDDAVRLGDLDGDGHVDVLLVEDEALTWYPSLAADGFGPAVRVPLGHDEEKGPRLVHSDDCQSVLLADLSGDGLADLVRIRNAEVCYWPSLGHGRFGPKVTMDGLRPLDDADRFDPRRVRLADVDGTGATDLIYLHRDGVRLYFNQSGNGWAEPVTLAVLPPADALTTVEAVDLLGDGTACLAWSSASPADDGRSLRFVRLLPDGKPHLLTGVVNNLGAETTIGYAPSTAFAQRDALDGRPWPARLPFPVHVVARVETNDRVGRTRLATRFAYHDGYFDGEEREFRGFGVVETWDAEAIGPVDTPPTLTRTWFHTGVSAVAGEDREADRALTGSMLRQEIYGLDGTDRQDLPYKIEEHAYEVRLVQPRGANPHAVFTTHRAETVRTRSERRPDDPRVEHELMLDVDDFGNVRKSVTADYGRAGPPGADARQTTAVVSAAEHLFTNGIDDAGAYRSPMAAETRGYELTGYAPHGRFRAADFVDPAGRQWIADREVPFEERPPAGMRGRRLVSCVRTLYRSDDLSRLLPVGVLESRALAGEGYRLAFTDALLATVLPADLPPATGYQREGDRWWQPSGRAYLSPGDQDSPAQELAYARAHFFLPLREVDPYGGRRLTGYDPHDLLVAGSTDAVGNQVRAESDYRVLQPRRLVDANGNVSEALFDALGFVTATAVAGKSGQETGDSLDGLAADLSEDVVDPAGQAVALLGRSTTRMVYDLDAYRRTRDDPQPQPAAVLTLARQRHVADRDGPDGDGPDGDGPDGDGPVEARLQYSDGFGRIVQEKARAEGGRWAVSGWTVFNNKGDPVRRYEPFFSATPRFEFDVRAGVSPLLCYDPVGRIVATVHPDGSYEKVVFDSWQLQRWDRNDTALDDPRADPDVAALVRGFLPGDWQPWLATADPDTAAKVAAHARTPAVEHLDAVGRTFLSSADLGSGQVIETRTEHDIEGNVLAVRDALDRVALRHAYDLRGRRLREESIDAGRRWFLPDADDQPLLAWDERGHRFRTEYDPLRRPVLRFVRSGDQETRTERLVYGEEHPAAATLNLRGGLHQHFDEAGLVTVEARDVRDNVIRRSRQLWADHRSPGGELDPETFTSLATYDAIGRPVTVTTPHTAHVLRSVYNEAGLLERVEVDGAAFVTGIDYDAHGRRQTIAFGNGVTSRYEYDPRTFRLARLSTDGVQDLRYSYDPAGNITAIRDEAQQTVFFANQVVEPGMAYVYDAVYRLIEASGREHVGQAAPHSQDDAARIGLPHPGDGQAMTRYAERYTYDAAGNMLAMRHTGWSREFTYAAGSNRLTASGDERFTYDEHGNLTGSLAWDHHDRLSKVDLGGGGTVFYAYDADGQRVRKVWEKAPGLVEERVYLDGYELFRRRAGAELLERETLHVPAGELVALVENRTADTGGRDQAPAAVVRYQVADHLGSASLELDEQARILSYEEYTPYGSTSYQAVASQTPKRYRFTGAERDEETGFTYHGARYYAPWLARWTAPDPAGDGLNRYEYVHSRPTIHHDPNGGWAVLVAAIVVVGVAMFTIMTSESEAGAPTSAADAKRVKPAVTDTEFLIDATVNAASGGAGAKVAGVAMKGAPTVMKTLVAGAVAGGTQAVADQGVQDARRGKLSSGGTYADRGLQGAAVGAATGVVAHAAGKVIAAEARGLTGAGKPPANPYNTKANARYYNQRPAQGRDVGAAALKEHVKPGPTSAQRNAESNAARDRYLAGGGKVTYKMEWHHIASDKALRSGWTAKFEALFERAGLDLNDRSNLVRLRDHGSNHGGDYHELVYDRLSKALSTATDQASARVALTAELKKLATEITTKGTRLNQLATR
jgi:RHS repeat-associated protein